MTKRQRKQRPMVAARKTDKQRGIRERYLLLELQRLGYEITATGPYQFYIRRAA